jgi:ferritin-like metal-binding protein YciE
MAAKRKKTRRSPRKEAPDGTGLLALELQEIHSAESQLARNLPRMIKAAESEDLQQRLELRLKQGSRLLKEVETALKELNGAARGRKKNVAAEGLINDAREHIQEIGRGPALDAALIAAMQKTEHYCIAAWGTAKSLAQATGERTVVQSMERALKEGKTLDEDLTQLAEKEITPALLESMDEKEMSVQGRRQARSGRGASERLM